MHSGNQIIVKTLVQQKARFVFHLPGGPICNLVQELMACPDMIEINMANEQGAGFAAAGVARITNQPGVVLVTTGPGMTNIITAIADCYYDCTPLIVFCCQVNTKVQGTHAFQELDCIQLTQEISKGGLRVNHVADLQSTILNAYKLASSPLPGPVIIELNSNVLSSTCSYIDNLNIDTKKTQSNFNLTPEVLSHVENRLIKSKRPVILIGGGMLVDEARETLCQFNELYHFPIVSTMRGVSCYPSTDPCYLGMAGMYGIPAANYALANSDLIIALGARFADRLICDPASFVHGKTIISIDRADDQHCNLVKKDITIHCDINYFLEKLIQLKIRFDHNDGTNQSWHNKINLHNKNYTYQYDKNNFFNPKIIFNYINKLSSINAIYVTDVGLHQVIATHELQFNGIKKWLTSAGFGSMGFGLPAAIGVQLFDQSKEVWLITSEGSLQINIQELAIAMKYKLNLKIILLNNGTLGMIPGQPFMAQPLWPQLMSSYQAAFLSVKNEAEVEIQLNKALQYNNGPIMIHFNIDPFLTLAPIISPTDPLYIPDSP